MILKQFHTTYICMNDSELLTWDGIHHQKCLAFLRKAVPYKRWVPVSANQELSFLFIFGRGLNSEPPTLWCSNNQNYFRASCNIPILWNKMTLCIKKTLNKLTLKEKENCRKVFLIAWFATCPVGQANFKFLAFQSTCGPSKSAEYQ